MKKYIQSMMVFAAIVSFASCSSEDNNTTIENESAAKLMTFTATQEGDGASTKAKLDTNGQTINWEKDDKIKIYDGTATHSLTLKGEGGSSTGTFQGEANENGSYTAVYPYSDSMTITDGSASGVNLPANQTPTTNSFDKNAALMMAKSTNTTLTFRNAVGYVKVTPNFACSKIELKAADEDVALAGTGTLTWNGGNPKIQFTEGKSNTITLEGDMTAGISYYIAVPAVSLKRMWSISFTTSNGTKVYTRKGAKPIEFQRNTIINLGEFNTDGDYWYDEHRGIVKTTQEVDLGLTIVQNGTNYRVIFAKANLTATGLAASESDFGDYFAWAAPEPWLTSYTYDGSGTTDASFTNKTWITGKSEGYTIANAPYRVRYTYTKYTSDGEVLDTSDDAANVILGGDWRLPTTDIWKALYEANKKTVCWGPNGDSPYFSTEKGMKITKKDEPDTYIFLPAAGEVDGTSFGSVGSYGYYWSGTAYSDSYGPLAYYLGFDSDYVGAQDNYGRAKGCSVRPVRLVQVPK